ncbi:MAG: DUF4845 domain-containing protein [Porticoccaceae bacterium]|nr:DUF4845 domain-containing protein [Porticoccaceae bacterium]
MKFNKQRGATLTSTIIIVFIAGLLLQVAFKLGPHYLDNRIIAGAIQQIGQSDLEDETIPDIRRRVSDFFTINNIRDVPASKVLINRDRNGVRITLNYEKRIEMFSNVDVVLKFNNHYDTAEQNN